jgi:hypothetical protein
VQVTFDERYVSILKYCPMTPGKKTILFTFLLLPVTAMVAGYGQQVSWKKGAGFYFSLPEKYAGSAKQIIQNGS